MCQRQVFYNGGEKRICDGCDETTKCTTIKTIGGTLIICEDCVRGILECFFNSKVSELCY